MSAIGSASSISTTACPIYAYVIPAFGFTVVYSIREADGEVRIIALIDRDAERSVR